MNVKRGFIRLFRSIIDWQWYSDVNTCKLFIHCLLKANYSTRKWQGITIRKGEFITSIEKLAVETGLTPSKVRTSIEKLKGTNDISVRPTNKFTIITINPIFFDHKQHDKQNGKPVTNKSQSNNKPLATTNTKKEKDIITRKNRFRKEVFSYAQFSNEILNSFFNYWSELDKKQSKMRFEKETNWETKNRLVKWVQNEKTAAATTKIHKNR